MNLFEVLSKLNFIKINEKSLQYNAHFIASFN